MASVQSTSLPEELINGLRLITLLEKATEVLRNKFHQYFPTDQTELYNELKKHKQKLKLLLKQKIITRSQYAILLPATQKTDSSTFDISLLTLALRELCLYFQAPITGWETLPLPSDQSEGAVLIRIRIERNDLLHRNFIHRNKQYINTWNRIALALEGIGCDKQELIELKSAALDPALLKAFQQKIKDLKDVWQRVADLEDSLEGVTYNVFPSVPSFVGREQELSEIHKKLTEKDEQHVAMVIYGLGGIGKSEIACQYCQRYATSHYKRNVIWINAENKNTLTEDFFNVAERIKLGTTDANDKLLSVKTIASKVYRFFADRPVLFVFDNVFNKTELMDLMEHTSTKLSVLITSQLTEWGERFIRMQIDVLSKKAALALITKNLVNKSIFNDYSAVILCEKMQYLPLALQQSTAYINRWPTTIDNYLEEFEHHADKVMASQHGDEKYNKTIMTTWNMALKKLKEESNSSLAITLINMMSYLDGNSIKKELFYEYYDEHLVKESFELLQKYSLITIITADDGFHQTILMHSLLQYVVRRQSNHDYLQQFLDMVFNSPRDEVAVQNTDYGVYWWYHLVYMFCQKEWLNVLAPKTSEVITNLQFIFKSKGKLSSFLEILNIIEAFQIDTIGCKNDLTIKTKQEIAQCLQSKCNYDEALVKYKEVDKFLIEMFGRKHPSVLTTEHKIAECLHSKGNYDEALSKLLEIEMLQIEILGCKHPSTLTTQHSIALCLKAKGNYDEALVRYKEVGHLQIEILGRKHPSTLTTEHSIAECLQSKGNYNEALLKHMEVEKLQIKILGCKHPDTLTTQHNIVLCLQYKGNYDEALVNYMEVEKYNLKCLVVNTQVR